MASISSKLFLYAGVACVKGEYKVRFANDVKRIAALEKDGQTDVRLVNLPEPMTKEQSVTFIKELEMFQDEDAQFAFTDFEVGPVREDKPKVKKERVPSTFDKSKYTYAGIACKKGEYGVRFANDCMRYSALERDGQVDIRLHALPEPMSKYDAICYIMSVEMFDDEIAQQTLDDYISQATPPTRDTSELITAFAELDAELNGVEEVDHSDLMDA
jgi:hypothetical protein